MMHLCCYDPNFLELRMAVYMGLIKTFMKVFINVHIVFGQRTPYNNNLLPVLIVNKLVFGNNINNIRR